MAGSLIYSFVSMLLYIPVARICPADEAGVFAIAFTTSQMLFIIGQFCMREYQVTDQNGIQNASYYISARLLSLLLMLVCCLAWVGIHDYSQEKVWIILLLCFYKMTDAFGDVFEGYFQCCGKLYLSGQLLGLRSLVPAAFFVIVLYVTKDLVTACLTLVLVSVLFAAALEVYLVRRQRVSLWAKDFRKTLGLLKDCIPLAISGFVVMYISNASKYAIDAVMRQEYQTYYNIIFMPTFVINLLSGFIFKPYLLQLTDHWNQGNVKEFLRFSRKMVLLIAGITAMITLAGKLLGIPVLSLVYGVTEIQGYEAEFLLLLVGGGFSAISIYEYYLLTVMRRQQWICLGYLAVAALVLVCAHGAVRAGGLMGGTVLYLGGYILQTLAFALILAVLIKKEKRGTGYE